MKNVHYTANISIRTIEIIEATFEWAYTEASNDSIDWNTSEIEELSKATALGSFDDSEQLARAAALLLLMHSISFAWDEEEDAFRTYGYKDEEARNAIKAVVKCLVEAL